jgi:4-hydroxybenzoyl-CoA reductase subunit beta
MLRLPEFTLTKPEGLEAALALLIEHGDEALPIAGGTDLLPNMKHGLFEPKVLVSLAGVSEMHGVSETEDGGVRVGAMTTLASLAVHETIQRYPVLAQAASLVAGPQLREVGTLGGNVMLDTRCQWYNQSHFWRSSLGYCLKKDGSKCHVVEGGKKCVAAASNDTAPALVSLGAVLEFRGPEGAREVPIEEFYVADGIANQDVHPGELLVAVRIPAPTAGHRSAYGKLRTRGSIDFPLLGVACRLDLDGDGTITSADLAFTALQARPVRARKAAELLEGAAPQGDDFDEVAAAVAAAAHKQCHPLANIPGDHEYRREMVPVYVKRTLRAALEGSGPVHHI